MTLVARASVLCLALFALPGCNSVLVCGSAPDEAIESFLVTVHTGDEGTDADIDFCVTRVSDASRDCRELGSELADDFDPRTIEDCVIDIAVDAGDLGRVWIQNRGGASDLSMDGNSWMLEGVSITANTASGSTLLSDESDMTELLLAADSYEPACSF